MVEEMRRKVWNRATVKPSTLAVSDEAGPSTTNATPRREHPSPATQSAASDFGADWTLEGILKKGSRLKLVPRVSALDQEAMTKAIKEHERSGVPLIIEGWHKHRGWEAGLLDIEWLLRNKGNEGKYFFT